MLIPISWLIETVPGLAAHPVVEVARRLTNAGLAVEHINTVGDVHGVVVGQVLAIEELTEFKKKIRACQVDVGEDLPRDIICGADNFIVGDLVAVALPGTVLPGGFQIASRKTYGRRSDGMICSLRELGLGQDHDGIWVLESGIVGMDPLAAMRETVLDVAVTPDRGYCLSLRGVGREAATAFGLHFSDPADPAVVSVPAAGGGWPVRIEDPVGCDRYVARVLEGVDIAAVTPAFLQRRLTAAGMRPISAPVDVTNLVMLGVGQPLHAFDADRVRGTIVVRRAVAGERLVTLDKVTRSLDPDDLVIADDSGPIALAGVMGGLDTEVTTFTTRLFLESAHFDPATISRTARRHGLPSEASRRFERGVDPALAPQAAELACRMFAELTGASAGSHVTDIDRRSDREPLTLSPGSVAATAGRSYDLETVRTRLVDIGCQVTGTDPLEVMPASWRPDVTGAAELVEEVIRLEGYDTVPSVLPRVAAGRGLTQSQQVRRSAGRALAHAGWVEAVIPPFHGRDVFDSLGLPDDDDRRNATLIANPAATDAALLRTTLLPGLLSSLARNEGRGLRDIGLYECGLVFRPGPAPLPVAPKPRTDRRPSDAELAALEAALPEQPRRVALVASGLHRLAGWDQAARPVSWVDALNAARLVAEAAGVNLVASADQHAPWHPGRCAALHAGEVLVGHGGELHPRVCEAFGVPLGTVAMEVCLDAILRASPQGQVRAPQVSAFPPVTRDIALLVDRDVPAASVHSAILSGAGPLAESLRLFDRYEGSQVGEGKVSLAFRLVLRADDRTLTDDEANSARDAAVSCAVARTAAEWRG